MKIKNISCSNWMLPTPAWRWWEQLPVWWFKASLVRSVLDFRQLPFQEADAGRSNSALCPPRAGRHRLPAPSQRWRWIYPNLNKYIQHCPAILRHPDLHWQHRFYKVPSPCCTNRGAFTPSTRDLCLLRESTWQVISSFLKVGVCFVKSLIVSYGKANYNS